MTSYDIDIREIEPEYGHTTARQANRDLEEGFEVHLKRLRVKLTLSWGTGSDYDTQAFAVIFAVDHEAETVTTTRVGDAHNERKSFGVEKLTTALEYAERAAVAFLEDVGLDYDLHGTPAHGAGQHGDAVRVHTDLEVGADD